MKDNFAERNTRLFCDTLFILIFGDRSELNAVPDHAFVFVDPSESSFDREANLEFLVFTVGHLRYNFGSFLQFNDRYMVRSHQVLLR